MFLSYTQRKALPPSRLEKQHYKFLKKQKSLFCRIRAKQKRLFRCVPLRGVMAKMNKSDRPEIGRMYLFHNAGTIITHSAQKEKRNGEKNAAFPVRTAQEVRVKNMNFEILHRKFQLRLLRRAYLM